MRIANQMMTAKNNILLHVDEHSDFKIPRFNFPLSSVGNDSQKYLSVYLQRAKYR